MKPALDPARLGGNAAGATELVIWLRSFPARLSVIHALLPSITERFAPHVPTDLLGRVELVLAELLNNIAQHGRPPDKPPPMVHLSLVLQRDGLACALSDDGGLLPQACLSPRTPDPAQEPEGGFGWFLISHLTRSLIYFREEDRNYVAFNVPLREVGYDAGRAGSVSSDPSAPDPTGGVK